LFQTDPDRFFKAVASDDAQQRMELVGGTLPDAALCEILRWGMHNKSEMVGPLMDFYRRFIAKMPEEHCFSVLNHVVDFIENSGTVGVTALLPFVTEDARLNIAAKAVINYVSLGELLNKDPMSRVKEIVGMIESNNLENAGAAFGALLHLGDDRVCKLIRPLRNVLDAVDVTTAINCSTGFIHAATFEFYLDWLEGMEGELCDGVFGLIVAGLQLLRRRNWHNKGTVFTGRRPFPTRFATSEQWRDTQKPVPLETYIQRVAPRLYALERTEPPPRIMPHVLIAWDLQPRSDPMEAVPLDKGGLQ